MGGGWGVETIHRREGSIAYGETGLREEGGGLRLSLRIAETSMQEDGKSPEGEAGRTGQRNSRTHAQAVCSLETGRVGGTSALRSQGRRTKASRTSRSFPYYICYHSSHHCTILHSPRPRGCWVPLLSRSCEHHQSCQPPTPPGAHIPQPSTPAWKSWSLALGSKSPSTSQRVVRIRRRCFQNKGSNTPSIGIGSGKVKKCRLLDPCLDL